MTEVVIPLSSVGRHGWKGNEFAHIRKLKRGGYSARATYIGFNGYRTTILRTRHFDSIEEALNYLNNLYSMEFLVKAFLERAGEEWAKEKEELRGLLHVSDCS